MMTELAPFDSAVLPPSIRIYGSNDHLGSWPFSNSGRGVKLSVTSLPGSGFNYA